MSKILALQLLLFAWIYVVYGGVVTDKTNPYLSDEFIEQTNRLAKGKWTAERTFHPKTGEEYFRKLMGTLKKDRKGKPTLLNNILQSGKEEEYDSLPRSFDSRKQWPECPTIQEIKDQSGCGSCWAVGAASTMSDRLCIHSPDHSIKTEVSTEDLLTCCENCGNGCNGGWPGDAWDYWHENGLVSGGDYGTHDTCRPYAFEPCEHHVNGTRKPCKAIDYTPRCKQTCEKGYEKTYNQDKTYGKAPRLLDMAPRGLPLMKEIMTNGPIECSFDVYPDFLNYRKGVYEYSGWQEQIGGHAVRVIGWGEEHGTPYWLVANSWNTDWGENGLFKILRGVNHLTFEENCYSALPDFSHRNQNDEENGNDDVSDNEFEENDDEDQTWGDMFQDTIDQIESGFNRFQKWVGSLFS